VLKQYLVGISMNFIPIDFSGYSYLLSAQRNKEKWELYDDKHVFLPCSQTLLMINKNENLKVAV